MRRSLRILTFVASASLVGGMMYGAFRPAPIPVEVVTVARGRFAATVEEDGRTRISDRYVISAPIAGRLVRPQLKAGDAVAADEVVARILPSLPSLLDPRTRREAEERFGAAEAVVAETAAQISRLKGVRENADADAQRAKTLRQSGVVTPQQLERAELAALAAERELRAAELRGHAAEHALDQVRALLRRFDSPESADTLEVKSPISGRVLRMFRDSETPLSGGEPLLEIGDPADLEIAVDVLTTDAIAIRPGAPVSIRDWGGPIALQGRVRLVEPAAFTKISALGVEEQRVWVVIDLVSPREQWASLGDGFRVDASIVTDERDDVLVVPSGALIHRESGWAVFVVRNGRAHERPVEIAGRGAFAAVSSGLAPGDQVVNFPPNALREGAAVRPQGG